MLVLQRKRGQVVRIGNNGEIVVKVLSYDQSVIRLGIDAPKDMRVDREELYLQRQSPETPKDLLHIRECADISSFTQQGAATC